MAASPLPLLSPHSNNVVGGFDLDWNIGRKKRRHQSHTIEALKAYVVDLSSAGASILAPTDGHLRPGTRVIIGVGRMRGVVRVRWSHGAEEPGRSLFGVEHVSLSPDLESFLSDRLCSAPPRAARPPCRSDLHLL